LTNWYIRRSRRRFWKSQNDDDKAAAYATLYTVLLRLARIAAPFLPFISDEIHRNLRGDDLPESVHLCDYPLPDAAARDPELETRMDAVMTVVRLGRQLRAQHDLKVRQPLARLHVVNRHAGRRAQVAAMSDVIADELNVRAVSFDHDETALANLRAKANFRALGPRVGPKMKAVAAAVAALGEADLAALLGGGTVTATVDGAPFELGAGDVLVERLPRAGMVVATEGEWVVALETELTPELVAEGIAREFVNRVQNLRKDRDFEVTQRIRVRYDADPAVRAALETHRDYVRAETLCDELSPASGDGPADDLNGHPCRITVEPV